jgi:negative regulator of flagellin synthesis FlgM
MHIYGTSQVHGVQPVNAPHAARSAQPTTSVESPSIGDRLDISEAGQIASRLAELPEIRADRVRDLRAAIESGAYETAEKIDTAVERLLDEIA